MRKLIRVVVFVLVKLEVHISHQANKNLRPIFVEGDTKKSEEFARCFVPSSPRTYFIHTRGDEITGHDFIRICRG